MNKSALVIGIGGQDGAFLAQLLLSKGYVVWGSSRDAQGGQFGNLEKLGIKQNVQLISMSPEDFRSVFVAFKKCMPDEVYFLAGQSSVGLSFDLPAETIQSFTIGSLNILEACRMIDKPVRFYNAGSSECFGDTAGVPANEQTPFSPRSPYAVAKASSHWLVNNYREAYELYACTGILFNHESYLRPARFVTQKIIAGAINIAQGKQTKLELGRLDIARDWGWAPDYVEAMWLMLQQDKADDFVIATGSTYTLAEFVGCAFGYFNLNWQDYVVQNKAFFRPTDITVNKADPMKALDRLGWQARKSMPDVVVSMIENYPH